MNSVTRSQSNCIFSQRITISIETHKFYKVINFNSYKSDRSYDDTVSTFKF